MKSSGLKKGDTVVMVNCFEMESPKNKGRRFIVSSDPRELCGSEVCRLMYENSCARAYTAFATEYLKKVT